MSLFATQGRNLCDISLCIVVDADIFAMTVQHVYSPSLSIGLVSNALMSPKRHIQTIDRAGETAFLVHWFRAKETCTFPFLRNLVVFPNLDHRCRVQHHLYYEPQRHFQFLGAP